MRETGASIPDLDKLIKMSDLFGVTLDDFVRDGEIPPSSATTPINTEMPERPMPVKESVPLRKIFGAIFLGVALIFLFFGGWQYSAILVALSVICFVFKKHVALWCGWFTYFCLDISLAFGSSIRRIHVFNPEFYKMYTWRMIAHWALLLGLLVLIAATVFSFRKLEYAFTRRRMIGFSLGWLGVFGISGLNFAVSFLISQKLAEISDIADGTLIYGTELHQQFQFWSNCMGVTGFICAWMQIVALSILLVLTVARIRAYREKKNSI